MILRFFAIAAVIAVQSLLFPFHAVAKAAAEQIVITEVQTQSTDSASEEFIELYNPSELPQSLTGWKLRYSPSSNNGPTTLITFAGSIGAHNFLTIAREDYMQELPHHFTKGIAESGGHISVLNKTDVEIDRVGWGSATAAEGRAAVAPRAGESLRREAHETQKYKDSNDNSLDFVLLAPDPRTSTLADEEQTTQCDVLQLHEILPNPSGADTSGGEFIELYNASDQTIDTTGCSISTDKKTNIKISTTTIGPRLYTVVKLNGELLNTGGAATLTSPTAEQTVTYPNLGEGISWSLINETWQKSIPTPDATNIALTTTATKEPSDVTTAVTCPEGKERNPETNRCRTITTTTASAAPCQSGYERNPATNRCRKIAQTAAEVTPCQEGYIRNPETNRCRKQQTENQALAPCQEGYERNLETNRCRKIAAQSSTPRSTVIDKKSNLPSWGIIGVAGIAIAGLIGYEYRTEIRSMCTRLFSRVRHK